MYDEAAVDAVALGATGGLDGIRRGETLDIAEFGQLDGGAARAIRAAQAVSRAAGAAWCACAPGGQAHRGNRELETAWSPRW